MGAVDSNFAAVGNYSVDRFRLAFISRLKERGMIALLAATSTLPCKELCSSHREASSSVIWLVLSVVLVSRDGSSRPCVRAAW